MKSLLLLALISTSLCLGGLTGGWTKRSFNENDLGIETAVKKAFEQYTKENTVCEYDWFERLTVYSQLVNGVNYRMCFYAIDGEPFVVREFTVTSPPFSNPKGEYTVSEESVLKATENGNLLTSNVVSDLNAKLSEFLGENKVSAANVKYAENDDSVFYFVSEDGKNAKYLVVQDKKENSYDVHAW